MIEYDDDNVFAQILAGKLPVKKLYEDDMTLAFLDIMPQSDGHTIVIPKTRARNILSVDDEYLTATIKTVKKMAGVLRRAFNADGIIVKQLNETASGQVVFHLHFHVIPVFAGVKLRQPGTQTVDSIALNEQKNKIIMVMNQFK